MATKVIKNMVDARPLKEIYTDLSLAEKHYLREKVIAEADVSKTSFHNWISGRKTPQSVFQNMIVRHLKRIDIITTTETLFPSCQTK